MANLHANSPLGTVKVSKLMLKMAIPSVFAQLVNLLYNIVDRIYIGHMPEVGDLALTGVGVCMPLIMIISAFAALVAWRNEPKSGSSQLACGKTLYLCAMSSVVLSYLPSADIAPEIEGQYCERVTTRL